MQLKGQLRMYMRWPLIMTLLLIGMDVWMYMVDKKAGLLMSVIIIIYVGIAFSLYFYNRSLILADLIQFSVQYKGIENRLLKELAIPYAIALEDGRILWKNDCFLNLTEGQRKERYLNRMIPELHPGVFPKNDVDHVELEVTYRERSYQAELRKVSLEGFSEKEELLQIPEEQEYFVAVSLRDVTELNAYIRENEDQRMIAGLIYIDNYDEVMESVEEVRQSLLVALIDRKINKYIGDVDGIVKKLEKDKYFFAIKQCYMPRLEKERFGLLEEVKTVNIGNEMAVTLSIGIGMNGDTYSQNYDYARTAIDMALGRGGDQAVVKCGQKIQYYGGKAQQLEKTTRVKARVKAHALRELLETKDCLLIMGHKIGDIDCFGAAIGMYRIASALNKKAHIVINEVTSSVRPMMERFETGDYPKDLFLTGSEAADIVDNNTALVVVDVNRPSITEEPDLLKLVKTIVVIDHHRQSSEIITNATLSYVEPYASSACELVAEILQYVADSIRIKSPEADAMYAGIVIDTNNFTNQAGVRTFEAAAFLRRNGADVTRVRKLFRDSMEDYKAKAEAVRQAEVYKKYFAISVCPAEGVESPTVVGAQAANELLDIVGMKASVVLTPYEGKIYISARSIDEVNVQVMMEKLGGGGHRTIAGAQLPGATVEEAKEKVKGVIDMMLEKGEI